MMKNLVWFIGAGLFFAAGCDSDRLASGQREDTAGVVSALLEGQSPGRFRNSIGAELVLIRAGRFAMGTDKSEVGRLGNEVLHKVILTTPFYMGTREVTQTQWRSMMGNNPSYFKGDQLPVEMVNWDDCQKFCQLLTKKDIAAKRIPDGWKYRLPTEAQREYACRAGTSTPFHYGNSLDSTQANFNGETPYGDAAKNVNRQKTVPGGSFKPNAWGLYDMHGNVYEWCQDYFGAYPSGEVTDPTGPEKASRRVYRGGAWKFNASTARSAKRSSRKQSFKGNFMGFRVVLVLEK